MKIVYFAWVRERVPRPIKKEWRHLEDMPPLEKRNFGEALATRTCRLQSSVFRHGRVATRF